MKPKLSAFVPPARTSSCTDHLLPTLKSLGAQKSIIDHLHQVTAKAKEILGESMEREKTLRLIRGPKSSHRPLLLPCRLMRDFRSIIRIDMILVPVWSKNSCGLTMVVFQQSTQSFARAHGVGLPALFPRMRQQ